MTKELILQGVFITCRQCGCEYIEEKDWIKKDGRTKCPLCDSILKID